MECNKDEALRAKEIAEQKLLMKDAKGAKKFALKARSLFPELDGIAQLHEVIDIHIKSQQRVNTVMDYYAILNAHPFADEEVLRKQYRQLALALHPDKNQSVGAAEAFQILSQAWGVLSSKESRSAYDVKRGIGASYQRFDFPSSSASSSRNTAGIGASYQRFDFPSSSASSSRNTAAAAKSMRDSSQRTPVDPSAPLFPSHDNPPNNVSHTQFRAAPLQATNITHGPHTPDYSNIMKKHSMPAHVFSPSRNAQPDSGPRPSKPDTFWTLCNRCRVQYEYQQKFLNQLLLCTRCRQPFMATEMPAPNAFRVPHHNRGVFASSTGTRSIPASTTRTAEADAASEGMQRRREDLEHISRKVEVQHEGAEKVEAHSASNADFSCGLKREKPVKRRRMSVQNTDNSGNASQGTAGTKSGMRRKFGSLGENFVADQAACSSSYKRRNEWELSQREIRSMLIGKAKSDILSNLNAWKTADPESDIVDKREVNTPKAEEESSIHDRESGQPVNLKGRSELKKSSSLNDIDDVDKIVEDAILMTVPDADFHDFDADRVEKSFSANQVWAAYDDTDGMPRFYAVVHHVVSRNPFKMQISWLNSKSNSEFGCLDWVGKGFTKTCGDFRMGKYLLTEALNSFSHPVNSKKGEKGAIQIFPEEGDVWALYMNWSPEWNELTTDETIHKYDFVVVVQGYDVDRGVSVAPLVKVAGFTSVFRQHPDKGEIRNIPRQEMFRFSHQVPSYILSREEAPAAPDGCYELDPAALPLELLKVMANTEEAKEEVVEHNENLTGGKDENEEKAEAASARNNTANMENGCAKASKPLLTYSRKIRRKN